MPKLIILPLFLWFSQLISSQNCTPSCITASHAPFTPKLCVTDQRKPVASEHHHNVHSHVMLPVNNNKPESESLFCKLNFFLVKKWDLINNKNKKRTETFTLKRKLQSLWNKQITKSHSNSVNEIFREPHIHEKFRIENQFQLTWLFDIVGLF